MNIWIILLIAIIVLTVLLFLAAATFFFFYTFVRREEESRMIFKPEDEKYFGDFYKTIHGGADYIMAQKYDEHRIKSFDGVMLFGRYLKNGDSKKTVMLFHGYRSCCEKDFSGSFKYYVDNGFNVFIADQRAHENSNGKIITFGVKESRDLHVWLKYIIDTYGDDKDIYLCGLSMGAATVLFSTKYKMPENVKGIIADCGFDSPEKILRNVAKKNFHINGFLMMPTLNLFCMIFGRFSLYGISSEKSLKNFKKPVLFIHGTGDDFVPYAMSVSAFEAANEPKFLCSVEGASHGLSYLVDTPKVQKAFKDFIDYCESENNNL